MKIKEEIVVLSIVIAIGSRILYFLGDNLGSLIGSITTIFIYFYSTGGIDYICNKLNGK